MTVLSLPSITPEARYDGLAWTSARIEEATTEAGSYTLVETVPLDPVDLNPAHPLTRDFTTELATVGRWYRVVFVDASGDLSDPSAPFENRTSTVAAYATAAELGPLLNLKGARITENQDALDRVLLAAAGEIVSEIGRTDLAGWEVALAKQVNLTRAVELWQKSETPFGVLGLGAEFGATHTARDSWDRHAHDLAPLKVSWGVA